MKIKIVAFMVLASFAVMAAPSFADSCCPATGKTAAKSTAVKATNKATCPMGGATATKVKAGATCPMSGAKAGTCGVTTTKSVKAKAPAKKVVSAVCPVMGSKISDVSKASSKSVYKGKTYYFCCPGCKPLFDKNPGKYIKKK